MAALKTGQRVAIRSREITAEDQRTQLYFSYFGGLIGSVDRIYDDGTVCVDVELDSLEDSMRKRHLGIQEAERRRWLESLSDEMRNRLTAEQKQLKISYKILLSAKDLTTEIPARETKPQAREAKPKDSDEHDVKRLSEAEIAAKEEEFLKSREASQG